MGLLAPFTLYCILPSIACDSERKDDMNLIVLSLSSFSSIRAEGSSQVKPHAFQSEYERNFNAAFIIKSSNNNDLKLKSVMG